MKTKLSLVVAAIIAVASFTPARAVLINGSIGFNGQVTYTSNTLVNPVSFDVLSTANAFTTNDHPTSGNLAGVITNGTPYDLINFRLFSNSATTTVGPAQNTGYRTTNLAPSTTTIAAFTNVVINGTNTTVTFVITNFSNATRSYVNSNSISVTFGTFSGYAQSGTDLNPMSGFYNTSYSGGAAGTYQMTLNIVPVPEPMTLALSAIGIAGIAVARRIRKR